MVLFVDDKAILQLFWERNQDAIVETSRSYNHLLRQIAARFLRSIRDIEEILNDTYLAVWNTIPPHRPENFSAYLCKICRYLALGRVDYNNAQKRTAVVMELSAELEQSIPDTLRAYSPEASELTILINDFLKKLPSRQRRIFVLRYWYAYSIEEIAALTGVSRTNATTTLYRTRCGLKKYLDKEGIEI